MFSDTTSGFYQIVYLSVKNPHQNYCGYSQFGDTEGWGETYSFFLWPSQMFPMERQNLMGKDPFFHRIWQAVYILIFGLKVLQKIPVTSQAGPGSCSWGPNSIGSNPMPCHQLLEELRPQALPARKTLTSCSPPCFCHSFLWYNHHHSHYGENFLWRMSSEHFCFSSQ